MPAKMWKKRKTTIIRKSQKKKKEKKVNMENKIPAAATLCITQ